MYCIKFNKDTGDITGLSNTQPKTDNYVEVDEESYIKFAEDRSLRSAFVVKYSVEEKKYLLLPYVKPKVVYDVKDIIHHVEYQDTADCVITKTNDGWKLSIGNAKVLMEPNRLCRFSVTRRRDLHLLVRTFEVTVEQITKGHLVTFIDDEEKEEVSIYTLMVFNTYGLIDATI